MCTLIPKSRQRKDNALDKERLAKSKKTRNSQSPRMNSPGKSAPMTYLEPRTVCFGLPFFSLLFSAQLNSTDPRLVGPGEFNISLVKPG